MIWETRNERQSEQDRLVERFTRRVPRAPVTIYSEIDGDRLATKYPSLEAALAALSRDEGLPLTPAQLAALRQGERVECRERGNPDATLALWIRRAAQ